MIASDPEFIAINEPLNKDLLRFGNNFGSCFRYNYLTLTETDARLLKSYFSQHQQIRLFRRIISPSRLLNETPSRRVIKVIRANPLIDWFIESLDFEVIYLVRHPIAQSLSAIQRGHRSRLRLYLQDQKFMERTFNHPERRYIEELIGSGDMLKQFVLEWCIDNLIPLRAAKRGNPRLTVITYEELTIEPIKTINLLHDRLNLTDMGGMVDLIEIPSRVTDSSSKKTISKIVEGEKDYLISKWREHVRPRKERELFEILEKSGITAYSKGELLASNEYLHFLTR
jgi:hypothetical protein